MTTDVAKRRKDDGLVMTNDLLLPVALAENNHRLSGLALFACPGWALTNDLAFDTLFSGTSKILSVCGFSISLFAQR